MSAVTLTSPRQRPLRPLVEAAIQNEVRLLQTRNNGYGPLKGYRAFPRRSSYGATKMTNYRRPWNLSSGSAKATCWNG